MRPEAAALFTRGLERFATRDYAAAVADLEAGYAIDPRREFLFAEGQAKRLAGDCKGAVALYQRFLATNPTGVQANATQMALGRCAQHLADHPEVVVVQPPRQPPPPPPPPIKWWRDPLGSASPAPGVVGVGVGIGFIAASYRGAPRRRERATLQSVRSALVDGGVALAGRRRHARARRRADRRRRRAVRAGAPAGARVRAADRRLDRTGPVAGRRRVLIGAGARVAAAGVLALLVPLAARAWARATSAAREHAQCTIGATAGICEANGRCSVSDHGLRAVAPALRRTAPAATRTRACRRRATANPIAALSARAAGTPAWCATTAASGAGAATIAASSATARARRARCPSASPAIDDVVGGRRRRRCTPARSTTGAAPCSAGAPTTRGQLGDGGGDDRGLPQPVAGVTALTGATAALAAGRDFSCALRRRRRRALLGRRQRRPARRRRRGAGAARARRRSPGLRAASQALSAAVAARLRAARRTGVLACWGANASGQIGDGTTTSRAPPTDAVRHAAPRQRRPRSPPAATTPARCRGRRRLLLGRQRAGAGRPRERRATPIPTPQPVPGAGRDRSDGRRRRRAAHLHRAPGRGTRHLLGRERQRPARRRHADRRDADRRRRRGRGVLVRARQRRRRSSAGATTTTASSRSAATPCARRPRRCPAWRTSARWPPAARTTARPPTTPTARGRCSAGARTAAASWATARRPTRPTATRISSLAADRDRRRPRAHLRLRGRTRQLRCWGWGASGQLGQTAGHDMVVTVADRHRPRRRPRAATACSRSRPAPSHTCVGATISASVLCFGLNADGQLGNGDDGRHGRLPTRCRSRRSASRRRWPPATRTPARSTRTARSGAGGAATRASWATARPSSTRRRRRSTLGKRRHDGGRDHRRRGAHLRARGRAGPRAGDATPTGSWARRCRRRC